MRKRQIITGTIAASLVLYACKKEKQDPTYNPTAATVEVPAYVKTYVGEVPIPADNAMTAEGIELGRKLFYEKMLSDNSTMSCASCHKQENAFDDPRPFSEGTHGAFGDRNAMAIVNAAWDKHFFWDGRRASLEGQAHDPVSNPIEMANKWPEVVKRLQNSEEYPDLFFKAFGTSTIDSTLVTKAIAQFERTLVSFNSPFDKYYYKGDSAALTQQEKNGFMLFTGKAMCNNCHLTNTLFTDREIKNNGLDENPKDPGLMKFTGNAADRGKFKVPTLRNIGVTAPYMHDSRFATLEEVVDFYSSKVKQNSPNLDEHMPDFGSGINLTQQEKTELIAFLKSLTDKEFITNPKFSDPNN
ncbi:cytochrome-c peroxidase [Polluticoccus soli]|uniref:cytochrome-c peroxidase n=1 Tax=Polluticoccus soli TaxID=3034150 RepID=UPI0023E13D6F|nr:cytochrome c peroxidase [Flavipsychrobacter sp. JY13-12]